MPFQQLVAMQVAKCDTNYHLSICADLCSHIYDNLYYEIFFPLKIDWRHLMNKGKILLWLP